MQQSNTSIIKISSADFTTNLAAYWESKKEKGIINMLTPTLIGQGVNLALGTSWLGYAIDILLRLLGIDFSTFINGLYEKISAYISSKWQGVKDWTQEKWDEVKKTLSPTELSKVVREYVSSIIPSPSKILKNVTKLFSFSSDTSNANDLRAAYLQSPAYQLFSMSGQAEEGWKIFILNNKELKKEAQMAQALGLLGGLFGGGGSNTNPEKLSTEVSETSTGFFSKLFSYVIGTAFAVAGFELFSDFLKAKVFNTDASQSNIFNTFSLTGMFSNDPNDKIRPKPTYQKKYAKNPSFKDERLDRVPGPKDYQSIKQVFINWANEAYSGIDQQKLANSSDLAHLVNITYQINSDIWSAPFFLLPNTFQTKQQIVDFFIDDVAEHKPSVEDLRQGSPSTAESTAEKKGLQPEDFIKFMRNKGGVIELRDGEIYHDFSKTNQSQNGRGVAEKYITENDWLVKEVLEKEAQANATAEAAPAQEAPAEESTPSATIPSGQYPDYPIDGDLPDFFKEEIDTDKLKKLIGKLNSNQQKRLANFIGRTGIYFFKTKHGFDPSEDEKIKFFKEEIKENLEPGAYAAACSIVPDQQDSGNSTAQATTPSTQTTTNETYPDYGVSPNLPQELKNEIKTEKEKKLIGKLTHQQQEQLMQKIPTNELVSFKMKHPFGDPSEDEKIAFFKEEVKKYLGEDAYKAVCSA